MTEIKRIPFGNRHIGSGEPVVIIAEIGINHEGDAAMCARMIEEAAKAGADAIKLQTIDPDENYVPGTESHELFKKAWLEPAQTAAMFDQSRQLGLEPFTTAGDFKTLDFIESLNPAAHKISSGLLTNTPIIRHAARTGRSLLMSTGMNDIAAIDAATQTAQQTGNSNYGLFQCTSVYPAPPETLNLNVIATLNLRYGVPCGFSDHSEGTEAAALSVASGARMIEKHFTLDRSRPSYDHRLSLEPKEFKTLVERVRRVEAMLGDPIKSLNAVENTNARRFHRCLVARRSLSAGHILEADDIGIMRVQPGEQGLPPSAYDDTIGQRASHDIPRFTPIGASDIEAAN
jgi:N,N'-diacetyllegionaminate synthase